ncbi:MAG: hypothetical protein PUP93_07745, partial [Rhizonema sp. NSF051]|nr:hypothetical protein [Rhizonema sp. NSF051]
PCLPCLPQQINSLTEPYWVMDDITILTACVFYILLVALYQKPKVPSSLLKALGIVRKNN